MWTTRSDSPTTPPTTSSSPSIAQRTPSANTRSMHSASTSAATAPDPRTSASLTWGRMEAASTRPSRRMSLGTLRRISTWWAGPATTTPRRSCAARTRCTPNWWDRTDRLSGPASASRTWGPMATPTSTPSGHASSTTRTPNQFLLTWHGDDNTPPLVDEEYQTYGQVLAADGTKVGTDQFRISQTAPTGTNDYNAARPTLDYNSQTCDYMTVWNT